MPKLVGCFLKLDDQTPRAALDDSGVRSLTQVAVHEYGRGHDCHPSTTSVDNNLVPRVNLRIEGLEQEVPAIQYDVVSAQRDSIVHVGSVHQYVAIFH